jgi:hypothetical protein
MWRYHHQVSHHIHCNDEALDEDVINAFPILRFDPRLPKAWYHQYQHLYMWAVFPLLQLSFQVRPGSEEQVPCIRGCVMREVCATSCRTGKL